MKRAPLTLTLAAGLAVAGPAPAQQEAATPDPLYHTFSIVAIDPATGESGVAVTTRVPCVGNGVPWVRAGAGAVATQAWTRVEYGPELLEQMERGVAPAEALAGRLAADERADRRQVGAIGPDGQTAQHTGGGTSPWAGHRAGPSYATQGNLLVGPEVLEAVARTFEASEGSARHLADRLIEALAAGQAAGGDARKGRLQSAAVVVADPRPGISRRPDGITTRINVCEHPTPVAEVRRIYDTISRTLGYRALQQHAGADVYQLKVILHALGYFRPGVESLEGDDEADRYGPEAVAAVDRFRADQGLSTPESGSPPGLVDAETVDRLWAALARIGKAEEVRRELLDVVRVRR
ncbi:MAG: DUF1028 domain-containing protein [Gemmatimonadetes bacterium]|nr:DUF1028 domain-containing protein [Gemmatimonadota bacterium]NIQ59165.1 DUF1028 domain-containing protein [Gemmatimonadota bacterium]NIU79360.1 DUF1028 domain-containing protein [Gammaproteobacteria bacterium]NIX48029.1 DUF1028 domain-containing protein [Gemmatimonadota bacterium]NIY12408.1 DUF1028 domain-containing protein [Gemmatimonadota bacterium]